VEGLMVLDIQTEKLLAPVVPTRGAVRGIAVTPDSKKIFLAMGVGGLIRISSGNWERVQITDRVCPEYLEMDHQGKNLYVSYQNSGPGGQPGHDVVEVFDVQKEQKLWTVSGPPIVGGRLFASPDDSLVLLDGLDACDSPQYDHRGCPVVPSRVVHLLRPADRQVVKTLAYPKLRPPLGFFDNSRFLMGGASISVIDARTYGVVENLELTADYTTIAVAHDGRHIYAANRITNSLLVLETEGPECSPFQSGLSIHYSADGVLQDVVGLTRLEAHGNVTFRPGKVGQAFALDGRGSFLESTWTGTYEFGRQDASLALYVQFSALPGERTLLSRMSKSATGIRLLKSERNQLVFRMAMPDRKQLELTSTTAVTDGVWYHVVVAKNERQVALYVNGALEDTRTFGAERPGSEGLETAVYLGSGERGEAGLKGLLDEVAFYSRALSDREVRTLFQIRDAGPCRP